MALLIVPSEPQKGEVLNFTLNVSDLSALIPTSYYANQNNWSRVLLLFKSFVAEQLIPVTFYPDGTNTLLSTSMADPTSRNLFKVYAIVVYDKQNGHYIVKDSDIPGVETYNLVFPASGESFFPFSGDQSYEKMGQDEDFLYTTSESTLSYESVAMFHSVLSSDTGAVNNSLSRYVNQWETVCFKYNSDKTKLRAIGRYGLTFAGKTLPAITVGANYTTNPPRLVEIDLDTNVATWLCDFEDTTNFANFVGDFFIDETLNLAIVLSTSTLWAVAAYDITTNTKVWQNANAAPDTLNKIHEYDATHFFYYGTTYGATTYTQRTLIKVDKATGALVPIAAQPNPLAGAFYAIAPWNITPDKTQIYISYYDGSNYGAIYDIATDSWVGNDVINLGTGGNGMGAVTITDSFVFYQKAEASPAIYKFSRALVRDNTFPTLNPGYVSPMYANDDFLYYRGAGTYLRKVSAVTGAAETSYLGFFGADATILDGDEDHIMVRAGSYFGIGNCLFTTPPAANTKNKVVAKVDKATREVVNLFQTTLDFFRSDSNEVGIYTSPLIPGIILGQDLTGQFLAYDTNTGLEDPGWPLISFAPSGVVAQVSGQYLYYSIPGTSATTVSVTDSSGTFSMTTLLFRINLLTKRVDQSFEPVFSSNLNTGPMAISITDNYIYVSTNSNGGGSLDSIIARVNRTTQAVQYITATDLFGSSQILRGRYRFYQYDTDRVALILDRIPGASGGQQGGYSPQTLLPGSKPYMNFVESTLAQDATQPVNTAMFTLGEFNPTTKHLAGYIRDIATGIYYLGYYDILANSRNLIQNVTGSAVDTGNIFSFLGVNQNPTMRYLQPDGEGWMLFLFGIVMLDQKVYNGVMRFEPFGIPNNGE